MLLLLLIGTRRQREMASAGSSSSPESRLAKCFVWDKPWVTPSLKHMAEQGSQWGQKVRQ
jgi:hypothetical protein